MRYSWREEANPLICDKSGRIPLHFASESGQGGVIRLLLTPEKPVPWKKVKKMLVVGDVNGKTPLHTAAATGNVAAVKLLLKRGAKISMQDKDGRTALHCAAENGHEALVTLLLERSAKVSHLIAPWAVMHCAVKNGHEAVVRSLLGKGADIDARDDFKAIIYTGILTNLKSYRLLPMEGLNRTGSTV